MSEQALALEALAGPWRRAVGREAGRERELAVEPLQEEAEPLALATTAAVARLMVEAACPGVLK